MITRRQMVRNERGMVWEVEGKVIALFRLLVTRQYPYFALVRCLDDATISLFHADGFCA